jgi:uncharacterized protein (DUF1330 family)
MPIKICANNACSKQFKTKSNKRKYCSHLCYSSSNKRENSVHWKGGKRIHPDGYVMIHCPDHPGRKIGGCYVMEHRLVMEKHIGRFLEHSEAVHHVNGQRQDNKIENLVLLKSNGAHTRECHRDTLEKATKVAAIKNRVDRIVKNCPICGKEFETPGKTREKFFCSLSCYNSKQSQFRHYKRVHR